MIRPGKSYYLPWSRPVLFGLAALLALVVLLVRLGLVGMTFAGVPVHPMMGPMILMASLVGAGMNLTLGERKVESRDVDGSVRAWGIPYRAPEMEPDRVQIALNMGGAAIPLVLAMALAGEAGPPWRIAVATGLVAAGSFLLSRPVPGVGIVVPAPAPGLVAAAAALLLCPRENVPAVVYIAGSAGTLIGADIIRLKDLGRLGGTVASIGGPGTFEGIFLSGIIAVLLS
jgi:uncharacterized membrane protein